ncbi:phosphoesterase [Stagnimonas aquatica]|uniref:phospholipase C n=1 Tax=Stagnimonas aquatica TaxID=2689987 RepID=A0A3N0VL89_9GAMM|nr:alkaline phosphatase family protein [Stagnimonas aquatica]ROH93500.1 phosphoesterase [Stagnimonas aquatica]
MPPPPPLDRREFLKQAGLVGAAVSAGGLAACGVGGSSSAPGGDSAAAGQWITAPSASGPLPDPKESGIEHLVVVMMENRSFDHMLGWVPGANGRQAGLLYPDAEGKLQATHRLSTDYQGCGLEDPPHGYDHGHAIINGGRMDGFLRDTPVGDLFPIGYYTAEELPFYAGCAQEWTICDRYHSGMLASTQSNRMYIHCGQSDRNNNSGGLFDVLPKTSTLRTVWDAAAEAGVSTGYYFNNLPYTAIWGGKYLGISRPYASFALEAAAGLLPAISYVDPFFYNDGLDHLCNDDHPHADVRNGQSFLNGIYDALRRSPTWDKTLMVICYDEWGGFFDHVEPPYMPVSDAERDEVGNDGRLGFRVPCVLIGPRARRGHVEKMLLEPNSILKFMEWRWGLEPLGVRAAATNNLAYALDFNSAPRTEAPAFSVPLNPYSQICALGGIGLPAPGAAGMTGSMRAHADEIEALQEKARRAGFRW